MPQLKLRRASDLFLFGFAAALAADCALGAALSTWTGIAGPASRQDQAFYSALLSASLGVLMLIIAELLRPRRT